MKRRLPALLAIPAVFLSALPAQEVAARGLKFSIQGVVTSSTGEPVPAASVEMLAAANPDRVLRSARSDGEGRYRLDFPVLDAVVVQVRHAGHARFRTHVPFEPVPQMRWLEIVLQPAGEIRGVVVDADGEPVAGAGVIADFVAALPTDFETQREAVTGDDGRFDLPAVPLGEHTIAVHTDGFAPHQLPESVRSDGPGLRIVLGRSPTGSIELEVPASVADTATVSVRGAPLLPDAVRHPRVDADGRAVVHGVPPGVYQVACSAPGMRFSEPRKRIEIRGGEVVKLGFTGHVRETLSLPGRVVDRRGRPVASLGLIVWEPSRMIALRTDADGRFEWRTRMPEETSAYFHCSDSDHVLVSGDLGPAHRGGVRVELGGDSATLRLRADPVVWVRGRVLDVATEAAIAGVAVHGASRELVTDIAGAFAFPIFAGRRGAYELTVRDLFGKALATAEVASRGRDAPAACVLRPPGTGRIRGRVLDASGDPVAGLQVALYARLETTLAPERRAVITDARGRFGFAGLLPGRRVVSVRQAGELGLVRYAASVEAGKPGEEIVVRLD